MAIIRTDSANADFHVLISELDKYLAVTDGDEHGFYDQFNKVDSIKHVIVAYDGQTPVGCGAIKPLSDDTMEIKRMYVLPEYRGNGIAGKLLAELEAWAYELGYNNCMLETGKRQPEAIRLYLKSGYSPVPNYGQYIGMDNSVCFKKEL